MFDLDAEIRRWRNELLASEALCGEDVDELEDHLREEFAQLRAPVVLQPTLLSEEESFLIAARRLGQTDALATEFTKADPFAAWRRRGIWMLAGYLGIGFAMSLISTVAAVVAFPRGGVVGHAWLVILYCAVILLGFVGLLALARFLSRRLWTGSARAALALKLLTKPGLAVLTLLAFAAKFAIAPTVNYVFVGHPASMFGLFAPGYWVYPQLALSLAPFLLLAVLIWRDRERLRGESSPQLREQ